MSTEIAVKDEFNSEEFSFLSENDRKQLAVLAKSGLFPKSGGVYQAVAKLQIGKTLGISPVEALRGIIINPQNGQASFTSQLISSLVKTYKGSDGKEKYRFNYERDEKDYTARFEIFERIDGEWQKVGKLSFGPREAKIAGLDSKDTYKKYPWSMYYARGVADLSRCFCSDIAGGNRIYTHEEIQDDVDMVYDAETEEFYQKPVATIEKKNPVKFKAPVVTQVLTKETKSDKITDEQKQELLDLAATADVDNINTWLNFYGKSSIDDLTQKDYSDLADKLTKKAELV